MTPFVGVTTDMFVGDASAWRFWESVLGRPADLHPDPDTAEWKLAAEPEIALRVRVDAERAGTGRLGLGVADLVAAAADVGSRLGPLPEITTKPGVIATLELHDPDGNR
ncbi:MAG TPA: VOC family protein, partial [Polyangiaceae bacterium]|nr:VOC family protein [Polyangiaceae bacterium]